MVDCEVRNRSVVTGNSELETLYTIPSFPVFIGCTEQHRENDLFCDMSFDICKESGVIQLKNLLPLDIVYSGYHSEAVGPFWENHHDHFCEIIKKYHGGSVLEIGGSNGFLARKFLESNNSPWTIMEPNSKDDFEEKENLKMIKGFFDGDTEMDGVDMVVHSHVMEHSYDVRGFLRNISSFLSDGQYHVFSIPNLHKYLSDGYTNTINFEHTIFLTETIVDYLLSCYEFETVEKNYFGDHSIFYVTKKNSSVTPIDLENKYGEYGEMYSSMMDNYKKKVEGYNERIKNHDGKVFLFGAHIFSQLPLFLGLEESFVDGVLDNSDLKEGKRLYGTGLSVSKPDSIKNIDSPMIIVDVGNYRKEIVNQIMDINQSSVII